jgi:hypothetical protein
LKKTHYKKKKKRTGGVAQGVGPEFKPQYHKQTNKKGAFGDRHTECFPWSPLSK